MAASTVVVVLVGGGAVYFRSVEGDVSVPVSSSVSMPLSDSIVGVGV